MSCISGNPCSTTAGEMFCSKGLVDKMRVSFVVLILKFGSVCWGRGGVCQALAAWDPISFSCGQKVGGGDLPLQTHPVSGNCKTLC